MDNNVINQQPIEPNTQSVNPAMQQPVMPTSQPAPIAAHPTMPAVPPAPSMPAQPPVKPVQPVAPVMQQQPPVPPMQAAPAMQQQPPVPPMQAAPVMQQQPPVPPMQAAPVMQQQPPVPPMQAAPLMQQQPPVPPMQAAPIMQQQPPVPPMQPMQYVPTYYPYSYTVTKKPKREYKFTKADTIFALLAFVMGYLFLKMLVTSDGLGIGATIHFIILSAYTFLYANAKDIKLSGSSIAGLCLIPIFSIQFSLFDNPYLASYNIIFLFIYYIFVCININHPRNRVWGDNLVGRFFIGAFYNSYVYSPATFKALGGKSDDKEKSKRRLADYKYFLLGLLVALPVCIIIIAMLYNADAMFAKIIDYIFSGIFEKILKNVLILVFGIPIAMYLFGMLYGYVAKKDETDEAVSTSSGNHHVIPSSAIMAFSIPLILVYLLFFFSQLPYFLSAFNKFLPENFSYAQYARRGFFELSAVVVFNLILIFLISYFVKLKDNGERPKNTKCVIVILSLLTLTLVATVISKMNMYIENYGLTYLRIFVIWFMILITLSFILIIAKQAINRMNLIRSVFTVFVVMLFALCFSNVDGMIAKYNVNRYKDGTLKELDTRMIVYDLSPAYIEQVLPLLQDDKIPTEDKRVINNGIYNFKQDYEDMTVRAFNLECYLAHCAIEEYEAQYGEINFMSHKYTDDYNSYDDYYYD
ncbi:MAG: DUF4153 domain-containing protein [Acutalibacteraceae bacterium]